MITNALSKGPFRGNDAVLSCGRRRARESEDSRSHQPTNRREGGSSSCARPTCRPYVQTARRSGQRRHDVWTTCGHGLYHPSTGDRALRKMVAVREDYDYRGGAPGGRACEWPQYCARQREHFARKGVHSISSSSTAPWSSRRSWPRRCIVDLVSTAIRSSERSQPSRDSAHQLPLVVTSGVEAKRRAIQPLLDAFEGAIA